MQRRRNEQGGVLSFVIIGTVLVLLLVGGVLLAKYQARLARGTDTAVTSQQSESTNQPITNDTSDSSSSSSNATSGDKSANSSATDNNSASVPVSGPSGSDNLPSTGPSDIVAGMFAVGGVSAGIYAHTQSSRRFRYASLK